MARTRYRLHDARHTAATVLLLLGVPERAVMDFMGWSNSAMAKRYQHVTAVLRNDIAKRLSGFLWQESWPATTEPCPTCGRGQGTTETKTPRPDHGRGVFADQRVARGGIEPPTYRFSGGRSYQLSYLARQRSKEPTQTQEIRRALRIHIFPTPPRWIERDRTVGGLGAQPPNIMARVTRSALSADTSHLELSRP